MKCRWCGITDETYPYWRNNFCCDKKNCMIKDEGCEVCGKEIDATIKVNGKTLNVCSPKCMEKALKLQNKNRTIKVRNR